MEEKIYYTCSSFTDNFHEEYSGNTTYYNFLYNYRKTYNTYYHNLPYKDIILNEQILEKELDGSGDNTDLFEALEYSLEKNVVKLLTSNDFYLKFSLMILIMKLSNFMTIQQPVY